MIQSLVEKRFLVALFTISFLIAFIIAQPSANSEDYDRLDGTGASGKKVHVIEWEGNLEIHAYPAGSLAGLALKLDQRDKNKPVMVIGYRFEDAPKKQLIRRAILGIDLREGFKTYKDPSSTEYDKIIISNNGLSDQVIAYRLDPPPTQLYPDDETRAVAGTDSKTQTETRTVTEPHNSVDESGTIKPFFIQRRIDGP